MFLWALLSHNSEVERTLYHHKRATTRFYLQDFWQRSEKNYQKSCPRSKEHSRKTWIYNTETFPSQPREITCPARPGSVPGTRLVGHNTSLRRWPGGILTRWPNQLAPLSVEMQGIPNDTNRVQPLYVGDLFQPFLSTISVFWFMTWQFMTTDEGQNVNCAPSLPYTVLVE